MLGNDNNKSSSSSNMVHRPLNLREITRFPIRSTSQPFLESTGPLDDDRNAFLMSILQEAIRIADDARDFVVDVEEQQGRDALNPSPDI